MKKSKAIVSLAAGLLTLTTLGLARADYVSGNAFSCQPLYAVYTSHLSRASRGLASTYPDGEFYVACPVNVGQAPSTTFAVSAGVYLRYDELSYKAAVECRVIKTSANGSSVFSPIKYSCATVGGCSTKFSCNSSNGTCTDVVSTYGGRNILYWSPSELGFSSFSVNDTVYISCSLPRASWNSVPESYLVSYYIQ